MTNRLREKCVKLNPLVPVDTKMKRIAQIFTHKFILLFLNCLMTDERVPWILTKSLLFA